MITLVFSVSKYNYQEEGAINHDGEISWLDLEMLLYSYTVALYCFYLYLYLFLNDCFLFSNRERMLARNKFDDFSVDMKMYLRGSIDQDYDTFLEWVIPEKGNSQLINKVIN